MDSGEETAGNQHAIAIAGKAMSLQKEPNGLENPRHCDLPKCYSTMRNGTLAKRQTNAHRTRKSRNDRTSLAEEFVRMLASRSSA